MTSTDVTPLSRADDTPPTWDDPDGRPAAWAAFGEPPTQQDEALRRVRATAVAR
jgi:hypothetical protein